MISRSTVLTIQYDSQVYASAIGPYPNGLYGFYIGTYNESPSGSTRPVDLLTSEGIYPTQEAATEAGESIIREIRAVSVL